MLLSAATGCVGRVVSEGVGLVGGVSAIYVPVEPVEEDLDVYERFELGEFQDDFGGRVPTDFWRFLELEFVDEIGDRNIPNAPEGKTLVVRGRVIHIETRAISGVVLGDFEEVVARVELVDKNTGEVLGVANCIGRSNDSVNRGLRKKADGLAEAIAIWIDASYPDESKPPK